MNDLTIGIVGAGSVGGILAACLVHRGARVIVCDIDREHLRVSHETGLVISGKRELTVRLPDVHGSIADLKNAKVDILFLALKTTALESVALQVKEFFHDRMLIVSYQNGLGAEDFLATHFGKKNVARVIINYAGNLVAPGKIFMSFYTGSNFIGALDPAVFPLCRQIATMLTDADLPTEFSTEIKKHEWKKAILNCGLSPISALTGLTMKSIMDGEDTRPLVKGTLTECIEVARAAGIDFGDDFLDFCMSYLDKAGHHKPSMLIDVESKARTEIDFLNRKICDYGEEYGVSTPFNFMLSRLVAGIDRRHAEEKRQGGNG